MELKAFPFSSCRHLANKYFLGTYNVLNTTVGQAGSSQSRLGEGRDMMGLGAPWWMSCHHHKWQWLVSRKSWKSYRVDLVIGAPHQGGAAQRMQHPRTAGWQVRGAIQHVDCGVGQPGISALCAVGTGSHGRFLRILFPNLLNLCLT